MSTEVHVPENTETPATVEPAATADDLASKPIPNTRDLLREAAEKAIEESEGEETDRAAVDGTKPGLLKVSSKQEGESLKGLPKLAATLRAREQAQKLREEGKAERDAMLADAMRQREEVARMRYEAEAIRKEAEAERARLMRLRTAPLDAIKELGWDTEQLVTEVAREGTPEWQMIKRLRGEKEKQDQELAEVRAFMAEQRQMQNQAVAYHQQQYRAQVEREFLSKVSEDSALRALYEESEIVARGDRVYAEYKAKTGQEASLDEIREYLEDQAQSRLAKLRGQARGASGKPAAQAKAGNGQRTLSASASSERRAAPKPFSELKTPAEQRKALEEAASEAARTAS